MHLDWKIDTKYFAMILEISNRLIQPADETVESKHMMKRPAGTTGFESRQQVPDAPAALAHVYLGLV